MKKTKNILLWTLLFFMLTVIIVYGFSLSSVLLVTCSLLLMPIFSKYVNKILKFKGLKKQSRLLFYS